jgi:hypothetical protein
MNMKRSAQKQGGWVLRAFSGLWSQRGGYDEFVAVLVTV